MTDVERLDAERTTLRSALAAADTERASLAVALRASEAKGSDTAAALAASEAEVATATANCKALAAELAATRAEAENLAQVLRARDSAVSALTASNAELEAARNDAGAVFLQRERTLEAQVTNATRQFAEADARRIQLEGEAAALGEQVRDAEVEAREIALRLEAGVIREAKLEERAAAAQRDCERAERSLDERRAAAAAMAVRLEELGEKLAAEHAVSSRLQDEIDLIYRPLEVKERRTAQTLATTESKLAAAMRTVTTLNAMVSQEKAGKAEAVNRLEMSERSLAAVVAARQALQNESATLRQANKQQSGIMKQLQTAVQQLKQKVIQLQQKEQRQTAMRATNPAS
jgi:chromosome segregation ATPase